LAFSWNLMVIYLSIPLLSFSFHDWCLLFSTWIALSYPSFSSYIRGRVGRCNVLKKKRHNNRGRTKRTCAFLTSFHKIKPHVASRLCPPFPSLPSLGFRRARARIKCKKNLNQREGKGTEDRTCGFLFYCRLSCFSYLFLSSSVTFPCVWCLGKER